MELSLKEIGTMSEKQARYALSKRGYGLHKSCVQNIHTDNLGGYMIYDLYGNFVVAGSRYELTLDDVADWIAERR